MLYPPTVVLLRRLRPVMRSNPKQTFSLQKARMRKRRMQKGAGRTMVGINKRAVRADDDWGRPLIVVYVCVLSAVCYRLRLGARSGAQLFDLRASIRERCSGGACCTRTDPGVNLKTGQITTLPYHYWFCVELLTVQRLGYKTVAEFHIDAHQTRSLMCN